VLLARRIAAGELPETGARTSMNMLTLAEFDMEFIKWSMVTDIDRSNS